LCNYVTQSLVSTDAHLQSFYFQHAVSLSDTPSSPTSPSVHEPSFRTTVQSLLRHGVLDQERNKHQEDHDCNCITSWNQLHTVSSRLRQYM